MKQAKVHTSAGVLGIAVLLIFAAQLSAETQTANAQVIGDWLVKLDFNEWQPEAILSLASDTEGKLTGKWISGWAVSELKDVNYAPDKLTFVQVNRWRDRESTSKFTGTVKESKLSGTLSGERGDFPLKGTRLKPMPAAVGDWEIKTKMAEEESTATLAVRTDKDGKLTAQWQDSQGKSEITDVNFVQDKLSFTRKSTDQGQQAKSNYELTVNKDTISGTVKTSTGQTQVEGTRVGAGLIGKWELTITSERGARTQILQVNPDLSGLYGPTRIGKIDLEGDQVSFAFTTSFPDRTFETKFKGKLDGEKLDGQITGWRDTIRKVQGKKLVCPAKKD